MATATCRSLLPRRGVAAFVLSFALALTFLGPSVDTAHAVDDPADYVTGIEVQVDGTATSGLRIQDLYPGAEREAVLFLDGRRPEAVRDLAITVDELRDFENGCNRPEINAGDDSCGDGPDQGELSQWLDVTFRSGTETTTAAGRTCRVDGDVPVVGSLLSELATAGPVDIPTPETGGDDVLCVVATFHHEDRGAIDNLTQTDTVEFDIRLTVAGELPTEVGGVVVERPGDGRDRDVVVSGVSAGDGRATLGLPRTGQDVVVYLAVGLLLVATGVVARYARPRSVREVRP